MIWKSESSHPHTERAREKARKQNQIIEIQFVPLIIFYLFVIHTTQWNKPRENGRHFSTDPIKCTKQICKTILKSVFLRKWEKNGHKSNEKNGTIVKIKRRIKSNIFHIGTAIMKRKKMNKFQYVLYVYLERVHERIYILMIYDLVTAGNVMNIKCYQLVVAAFFVDTSKKKEKWFWLCECECVCMVFVNKFCLHFIYNDLKWLEIMRCIDRNTVNK